MPDTVQCYRAGKSSTVAHDRTVLNRLDLRGATDLAALFPRPATDDDVTAVGARHHRRRPVARRRGRARAHRALRRLRHRRAPRAARRARAALDAAEPELRAALVVRGRPRSARTTSAGRTPAPVPSNAPASTSARSRRPVDRAGLYVPGGRAAYPSTVLMTAIPAQVAGVPERVLCVPAGRRRHACPTRPSPPPRSPGSTRCTASAAPRRSPRWPTAPRPSARST